MIGAGMGGLAAGAALAKLGHHVTILERSGTLGGLARTLPMDGVRFCQGPAYCWSFGPGEVGDRFLRFVGLAETHPFELMGRNGFEHVRVGPLDSPLQSMDIPMGFGRWEAALAARVPSAADGLRSLFTEMEQGVSGYVTADEAGEIRGTPLGMVTRMLASDRLSAPQKRALSLLPTISIDRWFDRHHLPTEVRRWLYATPGVFAESGTTLSAMVYAMGVGLYHQGARIPVRGFEPLCADLATLVRDHGGEVHLGRAAEAIEVDRRSATAVVDAQGRRVPCDLVLSDVSPRLTSALLGRPRHHRYAPSNSLGILWITLDDGPDLSLVKEKNLWWADGSWPIDHDAPAPFAPPRAIAAYSPTVRGHGGTTAPGRQGLAAFVPTSWATESALHASDPAAWREAGVVMGQQVVDHLDRIAFPGLAAATREVRTWRALDLERELGAEAGAVYGSRLSPGAWRWREPWTWGVDNLVNVSAVANDPGIVNCFKGALRLAKWTDGVDL